MHNTAKVDMLETRRICHLLSVLYYRSKDPKLLDDRHELPTRQFNKVKFKVLNIIKGF